MSDKKNNPFSDAIKAYLDSEAKKDPLFAETFKKEKKSLKECCDYIFGEVKKSGRQGFADAEIFVMAKHYYDEDDLKAESAPAGMKVVVNQEIQLTPEEIEKAKADARQQLVNEAIAEEKRKLRSDKTAKPIELTDADRKQVEESAKEEAIKKAIETQKQSLLKKSKNAVKPPVENQASLF